MMLERVITAHDRHFAAINTLYNTAFPLHEQRTQQGRIKTLENEDYFLYKIIAHHEFVGFIGCWRIQSLFYIEHIAICAEKRGTGLGQQSLAYFCQDKEQIVLEIDPIIDDVARRRLTFYEHSGFILNDFTHTHPNYRPEYQPHALLVLSYQTPLTQSNYERFNRYLKNRIMHQALL